MTTGYRCLIAGAAGAVLLLPGSVRAAQDSPIGTFGPAQPGIGARPGQQATYQPPPPIRPGEPISVLVFPFGFAGAEEAPMPRPEGAAAPGLTVMQQELATRATAGVKAGLLSTPAFTVVTYHPNSALVQRAQKDEIVRAEHLTGLVAAATNAVDVDKARNLTHRLGLQALMVGTLEVATPAANTVEVTLDAQLINSSTGAVMRQAAVSGAAAGAEGVPMHLIQDRAVVDAVQKIIPALGIELVAPAAPAEAAPASKAAPRRGRSTEPRRQNRGSGDARKSEADRKAERDARAAAEAARQAEKKQAEEARKAAEKAARAARDQERAAERARREAEKASASQKKASAAPPAAPEAPAASADVAKDEPVRVAQAAQPSATAQPPATGTVKGTANAEGQPVPYGYAIGEQRNLPAPSRNGLRVPPWLGVAAFLTGIAFLL